MRILVKKLIKEDKIEEMKALFGELIAATRKEDGCIEYALFQNAENPRVYILMEEWRDQPSLEAHMQTDHFKTIIPKIDEVTETEYGMEIINQVI